MRFRWLPIGALLLVCLPPSSGGVVLARGEDGVFVPAGATWTISSHGVCRVVNNRTNFEIFVPTSTPEEWGSFLSYPPPDVVVAKRIGGFSCPTSRVVDDLTRPFDQYSWLTTHNSHVNYSDARWVYAMQDYGIRTQLEDGVRGLMVDTYQFQTSDAICALSFGADCYPPDVYLCHEGCSVPGVGYALPRQSLRHTLSTIVSFLSDNPAEVVTVFLEDYTTENQLAQALSRVVGLGRFLYNPLTDAQWRVPEKGWPTLQWMIDHDKRLILMSDSHAVGDGIVHNRKLIVENYWSMGADPFNPDLSCQERWSDVKLRSELNDDEKGWRRLFVMNHYFDWVMPTAGAFEGRLFAVNGYEYLLGRIDNWCTPNSGRLPNYVAVDYYERPVDGRNAAQVVRELNSRWKLAAGREESK